MSFLVDSIQHLTRAADSVVARAYLAMFKERDALMTFLFHGLFEDEREIDKNDIDPLERTTVAKFRELVRYYLEHGYRFISVDDLLRGLPGDLPGGKFAMLTFDDGYFNNTRALAVLEEFDVPATFFISADHVAENKCYWWDVLYRELLARGTPARSAYHEAVAVKGQTTERIEAGLRDRFGPGALKPRGATDRPFSPEELRDFARHPKVTLGNHTANHAILLNYPEEAMRSQISRCQDMIKQWTGVAPTAIAYPNGGHDDLILKASAELGLRIGFTVRPEKNSLPLSASSPGLLRLGRFCPHDDSPMVTQCRTYRSDVLIYGLLRSGYLRLARKQIAQ